MRKITIAIDGYSGTGKSSTAQAVARELDYKYIDSGAMYRATTLHFLRRSLDLSNASEVDSGLANLQLEFHGNEGGGAPGIHLNGACVEKEIRSGEVNQLVSQVSAISAVRRKMVQQQREIGRNKGIVMDGRDIGTVVFPEAELKIFMTADIGTRTERRILENTEKGVVMDPEVVSRNLLERDHIDSTRDDSPLRMAEGAMKIDTSDLTFEEQVDKIVNLAKAIIDEG